MFAIQFPARPPSSSRPSVPGLAKCRPVFVRSSVNLWKVACEEEFLKGRRPLPGELDGRDANILLHWHKCNRCEETRRRRRRRTAEEKKSGKSLIYHPRSVPSSRTSVDPPLHLPRALPHTQFSSGICPPTNKCCSMFTKEATHGHCRIFAMWSNHRQHLRTATSFSQGKCGCVITVRFSPPPSSSAPLKKHAFSGSGWGWWWHFVFRAHRWISAEEVQRYARTCGRLLSEQRTKK